MPGSSLFSGDSVNPSGGVEAYSYSGTPYMQAEAISSPSNAALGVQGGQLGGTGYGQPAGTISPGTANAISGAGNVIGALGQGVGNIVANSAPKLPQFAAPSTQNNLKTPLVYSIPHVGYVHITPFG